MSSRSIDARRLGTFLLGVCLAWAAPVAYSAHGGMPYSALKLPLEEKVNTRLWAPQGWKFFTRDPQEPLLNSFVRDGDQWRPPEGALNASAPNYFGLSRAGRALHADEGVLAGFVPDSGWHDCKDTLESCVADVAPIVVKRDVPHPFFCGPVVLTLQKPVPWAWSRSARPVTMPLRAARLEVQC
jgi:antimicrobial peptide system SdpA family protein